MTTNAIVRESYRTLARLIQRQPDPVKGMKELRSSFRKELKQDETIEDRVREAGEQIAYLRIITPKDRSRSTGSGGRWVYKDGKAVEGGNATSQIGDRVHTNWDGSNLDPCSVKRHSASLKRAGFVNNLHAKGIF
mmetsp:Transcript_11268/g.15858  ORF Transcript_11268/g.15858 Transcript_11268/m.15858 type:complete len:135 (-) Transcript_11268:1403-1807(-)